MPKKIANAASVLLTVSGFLSAMFPAKGRSGCVLELTNGINTGLYYVPLSPHDCRRRFPEKTHVKFKVWASALPDRAGVIDTAGDGERLWEATGA